jgi:ATP-binding cassette subfamily C protein
LKQNSETLCNHEISNGVGVKNLILLQVRSFKFFNKRAKRIYILSIIIQSALGILDIIGITLFGIIGAVISTAFTGNQTSNIILTVLRFLNLDSMTTSEITLWLSFITLSLFICKTLLALFFSRKSLSFLAHQQQQISSTVIDKVLNSNFAWIKAKDPHELSNTIMLGITAAILNSLGQVLLIVSELFLISFFIILLIVLNPFTAIGTVLYLVTVIFLMNNILGRRITSYAHNLAELRIDTQRSIFNSLRLFKEIRVLGRKEWFEKDIKFKFVAQAKNYAKDIWAQQLPKYALELALILGLSLLVFAGKFFSTTEQTLPILAIYIAGGARIFPSLLRIQSCILSLRSFSYLAESAHKFIDELDGVGSQTPDSFKSEGNRTPLASGQKFVEVSNVSFSYPGSDKLIIDGLSLQISKGERVALVGQSGSGKSTLSEMILGLLIPNVGEVKIHGQNASSWVTANSGIVSYIPQDVIIINGSLMDNICLGIEHSDIDLQALDKCLVDSQLKSFIDSLPEGLATHVGINGSSLSGGQKQRISIARALYSNPELIIMDEATSSLDAETENNIIEVISKLSNEKSIIFIAHRLSSIMNFPRVVYLENGKMAGDGTFSELRNNIPRFNDQVKFLGIN